MGKLPTQSQQNLVADKMDHPVDVLKGQVIQSWSLYLSDGLAAFDLPLRVGDARPVELVRLLYSESRVTGNHK